MKTSTVKTWQMAVIVAAAWGVLAAQVLAHHSFAMYDQSVTRTMTGKLTRYIPGSNHAQLIFQVLDPAVDVALQAIGQRPGG